MTKLLKRNARQLAGWGRMWKLTLLAVLLLAPGPAARAQQVLVQANVADDTVKTTFGPNRRYFGHGYLGYGLVAGPAGPGANVRYGPASAELRAGVRLKRRWSQALALTADLGYAYQRYSLGQNGQKMVPSANLHLSESLTLHQLYAELGLRVNVGRRGNVVGRYVDLLAGGSWVAATAHTTTDEPAPGVASLETTERGLPYLRRWAGGAGVRLGTDRYALTGRYRLSSVWERDYRAWPALPAWTVGLEVGLF